MEAKTHWKKFQDNNYLGAYMLEPNKDMIGTIKEVKKGEIVGENGEKSKGSLMYFKEYDKPLILNTTNATTVATIYNSPYVEDWIGKKVQLYQMSIRAFGADWDVLRIRKWNPAICQECHNEIKAFQNMSADQLAIYTTTKYKAPLCSDCATKASEG